MEKSKVRNFCALLYPEDATHAAAMEKINNSYDYACCAHDKDVYTKEDELNEKLRAIKEDRPINESIKEGELKKLHYHYVFKFRNGRYLSAVAKELGIKENYLEESRNIKHSLMYLIHFNDEDKAQYSIEEVSGPLKADLKNILGSVGKSEVEKVVNIMDYLESVDNHITTARFVRWCLDNGCWDVYRRSPSIWHKVIEEHNYLYRNGYTKDEIDE